MMEVYVARIHKKLTKLMVMRTVVNKLDKLVTMI